MDINLFAPESFQSGHPHGQYRWLRENAPVFWQQTPDGQGYWALTRYADVFAVDRDFSTFSSEPTVMIADPDPAGDMLFGGRKMMLMMDPPQHTAFRRLVRSAFTREAASARALRLDALAGQIVDRVASQGACDFVSDIAGEMPSYVIAELMGLPPEDGRELYRLTEILHSASPQPEIVAALSAMFDYARGVIAQKRACPGDDLASVLLSAQIEGRKLDDTEFLLFFLLLIDAGGDTTRNLLGAGLIALLENPDQLRWLKADLDARLASAREELLRYCSPVVYMRRRATKDIRIGDTLIGEGQKVVMYFGAANRDPARFAEPDRLDLARTPNDHIAFGTGPHGCLGQHLARLEIDAVLRHVLGRFEDIEITAPPHWLSSNFIAGPRALPIRFRVR
ncbi:MAG: cytochrome P450 [Alphaproteobacteria bacterium]|nr:cytochrome P450 [Alphaproteobacteria bacterium]